MKQILFFLLWVGWGVAIGQQIPTDSTKANKSPYDYLPNAGKLLPPITPKSPTAAGLGRYGDYPVSLYTGLPTIEIPIHEFRVGNLTIPIKLTYHASGNKVNDLASWVGLGWSLHTGGTISRNVQGLPDETVTTGILSKTLVTPSISTSCLTNDIKENLRQLTENEIDTQRDLFTYQMPGGSNTFLLLPDEPRFVLLSPEPIRIAYPTNLESFTITDTEGNQFRFTDRDLSGAPTQTSTWHLNEIKGMNPVDKALYTYASVGATAGPEPYDIVTVQGEVSDDNVPGIITAGIGNRADGAGASSLIDTKQPQEIVYPGGKIQFVLESTTREGGQGLDYIDVFGYNVGANSYQLIKRFDFVYTLLPRLNPGAPNGNSVALLSQLRLLAGDAITSIGSYSFTYNPTALPSAGSRAKDFWGYYNGQTGLTLIPVQPFTYQPTNTGNQVITISIGDANRDPNETLMQAWVLQSVRYPTGGFSTFTYETNRYAGPNSTTLLAGGLRIRRIQSYNEAGQFASGKRYSFGLNGSGLGTPRFTGNGGAVKPQTIVQDTKIRFQQFPGTASPKSYSYRAYTFSSGPSAPLSPNEGSPVTYPEVTEYREDAIGNSLGKTLHRFRDDAADAVQQLTSGRSFVVSRSWDRGQLLSRLTYESTATPGQYRLQSQTINSYTTTPSGTTPYIVGFFMARLQQELQQSANSATPPCLSPPDLYAPPLSYNFSFGTTRLAQTQEYLYDDRIDTRYTLKTTQTDYSQRHYQPTETRTFVEAGAIVGTRYSYPQDFTYTIPASAEFQLIGIKTLQDQNVHQSVETISFKQEPMKQREYKTGQLTTYTAVTVSGKPIALPYHIYITETDFNNKITQTGSSTGPYAPSAESYNANSNTAVMPTPQPNTFPIDYVWQNPRLTMTRYDAQGKLASYSLTAGSTTSYTNATVTPVGGVLFSYPIAETKNVGQPSAQLTIFTYDVPLLGVSRITQPNGVYASYEYDPFGRLVRIRDQQGNILKQLTYRYATSTEAVP